MMLTPLVYFQRSLIYSPHRCDRLLARQVDLPQATVDLTVKSFDGLDLHGWIVLAGTSSYSNSIDVKQTLSNGRPVVLFFPGNAGSRLNRQRQMSVLASLDAHVVLVDYRGYGDNAGEPTEQNFARDARSVWNHLTEQLGVSTHRIVLYGESLGGGSATRLASELCQQGIEPGGLIAQSTFSSLVAAAQYHFPIVPVSLILVDRFQSDAKIPYVTCPILQIHGTRDSIVPFRIGQKLFDAAPAMSSAGVAKKQLVLPNTDHNDVYESEDFLMVNTELGRFLNAVASAPEPDSAQPHGVAKPLKNVEPARSLFEILGGPIVPTIAILLIAALVWWLLRARSVAKL